MGHRISVQEKESHPQKRNAIPQSSVRLAVLHSNTHTLSSVARPRKIFLCACVLLD